MERLETGATNRAVAVTTATPDGNKENIMVERVYNEVVEQLERGELSASIMAVLRYLKVNYRMSLATAIEIIEKLYSEMYVD